MPFIKLDGVVHICNPSTPELEAGESGVQVYAWLHGEFKVSLTWDLDSKEQAKQPKGSYLIKALTVRGWEWEES